MIMWNFFKIGLVLFWDLKKNICDFLQIIFFFLSFLFSSVRTKEK